NPAAWSQLAPGAPPAAAEDFVWALVWSSTATPFRAVYRASSCRRNHTHTKAFTKTKTELGQPNAVWAIGEGEASLVRNAVIFAVDVKTMKWKSIDLAGEPFLELTLPIKSDKRRGDCNMPA